jgi:hypothetical protein
VKSVNQPKRNHQTPSFDKLKSNSSHIHRVESISEFVEIQLDTSEFESRVHDKLEIRSSLSQNSSSKLEWTRVTNSLTTFQVGSVGASHPRVLSRRICSWTFSHTQAIHVFAPSFGANVPDCLLKFNFFFVPVEVLYALIKTFLPLFELLFIIFRLWTLFSKLTQKQQNYEVLVVKIWFVLLIF